jgi:hypothetical protein
MGRSIGASAMMTVLLMMAPVESWWKDGGIFKVDPMRVKVAVPATDDAFDDQAGVALGLLANLKTVRKVN